MPNLPAPISNKSSGTRSNLVIASFNSGMISSASRASLIASSRRFFIWRSVLGKAISMQNPANFLPPNYREVLHGLARCWEPALPLVPASSQFVEPGPRYDTGPLTVFPGKTAFVDRSRAPSQHGRRQQRHDPIGSECHGVLTSFFDAVVQTACSQAPLLKSVGLCDQQPKLLHRYGRAFSTTQW